MLGLLLVYWIGKSYYNLAKEHHRRYPIGFGLLGVASYYLGTLIGGIVIFLALDLFGNAPAYDMDDTGVGLIALPFGILCCYLTYRLLEKRWKQEVLHAASDDLLDDEWLR